MCWHGCAMRTNAGGYRAQHGHIKSADWVIDLGPEGGNDGGRIVAGGPPERIVAAAGSHTGRFLARRLVWNIC
ncbi:MAG: hypothetical protein CM1200mP29_10560 [Verrucomicrobiota bacterium]|nr:MAG: hypothetical protein CM1200mP29_10560 [Verrucomicrobiota bacterium]